MFQLGAEGPQGFEFFGLQRPTPPGNQRQSAMGEPVFYRCPAGDLGHQIAAHHKHPLVSRKQAMGGGKALEGPAAAEFLA
jgi:hypothetical protein